MKYFILIFLYVSAAYSFEVEKKAVVRNDRFKAKTKLVVLEDLVSKTHYEGKYFKIVLGKSSEAIPFDLKDEKIQLRAATAYYHLSLARKYFVDKLNSIHVMKIPQIIIRIDIKNVFNDLGHFANDNMAPKYNNALSIPAGEGYEPRGIKPWGTEIWFRPSKKTHISELGAPKDVTSFKQIFSQFRKQSNMSSLQRFLKLLFDEREDDIKWSEDNLMRTFGTSLILELAYQTSGTLDKLFERKWYHLESSLIPEIIYHEFAHIALSDSLELSHSTSVIEGMADYFASSIAASDKLGLKIKKYNTFSGKKAKNKKRYRLDFETSDYANSDFVFGLLYELKEIFGEENADKIVYAMRKKIVTSDTIKRQLLNAIIETCQQECSNFNVQRYQLLKLFFHKGI